jgi:hypothetical protein
MAKVHYVECASCCREYYLDRILYEAVQANPVQKLKCPFCKSEFQLKTEKPDKKGK